MAIACQGGGSHTAFTAGVLKRLLGAEELDGYEVVGLSGTSGGAVCALLAWSALLEDDPAAAGRLLEAFWADNSATTPMEQLVNAWVVWAARLENLVVLPAVSPYDNPGSVAALAEFRRMLERRVDFGRLAAEDGGAGPMLLVGAVDVLSGEFKAFNSRRDRITADMVLASAAIPTLFRVRLIELARPRLSRSLGTASKLNRDPAFVRELIAHGEARAAEFLAALAFEAAWRQRDPGAVLARFADDAELVSAPPFPDRGRLRGKAQIGQFVREHLTTDLHVDPTRKQVARDRVTWTVRASRNGGAPVLGLAEAELRAGRVTALRLGG